MRKMLSGILDFTEIRSCVILLWIIIRKYAINHHKERIILGQI